MKNMEHKLGEIFYQGKMINLSTRNQAELEEILQELEKVQVAKKEVIKLNLKKMRREN